MSKRARPEPIHLPPLRATAKRHQEGRGWYWQVVYQGRKGTTAWSGYGTATDVTKVMADLIRAGVTEPSREDRGPGDDGPIETVADLLDFWLGSSVDLRVETGALAESTQSAYEYSIRKLKKHLGTVQLQALDQRVLDQYDLDRLRSKKVGSTTVFLERLVLGAAWRWGMTQGVTPNRGLPRTSLRPKAKEPKVPTRAQVAATLQHVKGWKLLALRIQAATGARISEVCGLRVGDVDVESGVVRIRHRKTERREVPLAPVVVDMLKSWLETERVNAAPDVLLLTARLYKQPAPYLNGTLKFACARAEVPRWTTHALRYRAVIDMVDAGVDPKTACEITGHSLATMLKVYRQVTSGGKRQAIQLARLGYLPEAPGQVLPFEHKGLK